MIERKKNRVAGNSRSVDNQISDRVDDLLSKVSAADLLLSRTVCSGPNKYESISANVKDKTDERNHKIEIIQHYSYSHSFKFRLQKNGVTVCFDRMNFKGYRSQDWQIKVANKYFRKIEAQINAANETAKGLPLEETMEKMTWKAYKKQGRDSSTKYNVAAYRGRMNIMAAPIEVFVTRANSNVLMDFKTDTYDAKLYGSCQSYFREPTFVKNLPGARAPYTLCGLPVLQFPENPKDIYELAQFYYNRQLENQSLISRAQNIFAKKESLWRSPKVDMYGNISC